MPSPHAMYIGCDQLENLPRLHRDNWLFELDWLTKHLPKKATVLQVGCMDGTRILRLLKQRPDLRCTGLEIDADLLGIAKKTFKENDCDAEVILGDITTIRMNRSFDFVLCLNNTLGYIANENAALAAMKKCGTETIISVYGEKFTDDLAREYFLSVLHLEIERQDGNVFILKDFGPVKRYANADVVSWNGSIVESPLGYLCVITNR